MRYFLVDLVELEEALIYHAVVESRLKEQRSFNLGCIGNEHTSRY
jgi:hypothetical protein